MTRRLGTASLAFVVVAALGLASCSSAAGSPATAGASTVPPAASAPAVSSAAGSAQPPATLTSPVQGVVLHVDIPSLGKVTGFRLLTKDGQQVDFKMGVQDNAAEFPAAHLSEHVASSEPVVVSFRKVGPDLVVYHLDDAPSASPSGATGSPSPAAS
jgi:hypothetical protein